MHVPVIFLLFFFFGAPQRLSLHELIEQRHSEISPKSQSSESASLKDATNVSEVCHDSSPSLLHRILETIRRCIYRFFRLLLSPFLWIAGRGGGSPVEYPTYASAKLSWPDLRNSSASTHVKFKLHTSEGRLSGKLPLELHLQASGHDKRYCIPPYNIALNVKINPQSASTKNLNDVVVSSLVQSAGVLIKSFVGLHLARSEIRPCTDLLISFPERMRITDKGRILRGVSPGDQKVGHSTFNHSYDRSLIRSKVFEIVPGLLTSAEQAMFQQLKDHIQFLDSQIDAPSTMAMLDSRCGLLYDSFQEESNRYSTYVREETQSNTFLAFFSDENPPVELEKVVPKEKWQVFRKKALSELRRRLGSTVACRVHSSFDHAETHNAGLCTSVKSQAVHNNTKSPLEKKGYIYRPVPPDIQGLWPMGHDNQMLDLEGVCFVALDRLVFEKLYNPNKELLMASIWEYSITGRRSDRIPKKLKEFICRLARAKLFCPCKSSIVTSPVDTDSASNESMSRILVHLFQP